MKSLVTDDLFTNTSFDYLGTYLPSYLLTYLVSEIGSNLLRSRPSLNSPHHDVQ